METKLNKLGYKKGGRKETFSLFHPFRNKSKGLKEQPYDIEKFRLAYLESGDYNGYACSQTMLTAVPLEDRWKEWQRLFYRSGLLIPIFAKWQKEVEEKWRSEATKTITQTGATGVDVARAKLVLSGELFKEKAGAGRPEKKGNKRGERTPASQIPASKDLDNIVSMSRK